MQLIGREKKETKLCDTSITFNKIHNKTINKVELQKNEMQTTVGLYELLLISEMRRDVGVLGLLESDLWRMGRSDYWCC